MKNTRALTDEQEREAAERYQPRSRYRVVFKRPGRVVWERAVIADSPALAVERARNLAEWLGVDVEGSTARAIETSRLED